MEGGREGGYTQKAKREKCFKGGAVGIITHTHIIILFTMFPINLYFRFKSLSYLDNFPH